MVMKVIIKRKGEIICLLGKEKVLIAGFRSTKRADDDSFICDATSILGFALDKPPEGQSFLSTQNGTKLSVAGYRFDNEQDGQVWSCSKRRSEKKCKCSCKTVQLGNSKYITSWLEHFYIPDTNELTVQEIKNRLKKRARKRSELPSVIVKAVTTTMDLAPAPYLPTDKTCQAVVKRAKVIHKQPNQLTCKQATSLRRF
jgi:hypothetical protein